MSTDDLAREIATDMILCAAREIPFGDISDVMSVREETKGFPFEVMYSVQCQIANLIGTADLTVEWRTP